MQMIRIQLHKISLFPQPNQDQRNGSNGRHKPTSKNIPSKHGTEPMGIDGQYPNPSRRRGSNGKHDYKQC